MKIPKTLRYTESHEWIDPSASPYRVGISDFAQSELSDVVYVELPEVGGQVTKGAACAVIESCKAASDVYAPISGRVAQVNTRLEAHPEYVNLDPYGDGWLFAIESQDGSELAQLLDWQAYEKALPKK